MSFVKYAYGETEDASKCFDLLSDILQYSLIFHKIIHETEFLFVTNEKGIELLVIKNEEVYYNYDLKDENDLRISLLNNNNFILEKNVNPILSIESGLLSKSLGKLKTNVQLYSSIEEPKNYYLKLSFINTEKSDYINILYNFMFTLGFTKKLKYNLFGKKIDTNLEYQIKSTRSIVLTHIFRILKRYYFGKAKVNTIELSSEKGYITKYYSIW